jgi:hypothetical protein
MCYLFRVTWPEPKPCKRKWGRVPFDQMLRHIRKDKCEQCRVWMLYLYRESDELAGTNDEQGVASSHRTMRVRNDLNQPRMGF